MIDGRDESPLEGVQAASLIRLTTLRVRAPGRQWKTFAQDSPSDDPLRGFVDIASEIPPIEAVEGVEVLLRVWWVAPAPVELEDELVDDATAS